MVRVKHQLPTIKIVDTELRIQYSPNYCIDIVMKRNHNIAHHYYLAMHKYASVVPAGNRAGPLFSGGRLSPLSRVQATATLRQFLCMTI